MRVLTLLIAGFLGVVTPRAGHTEIPQIRHIVIVIQENRTPDNLFQGLTDLVPAADIASFGIDHAGKKVALEGEHLAVGYDIAHTHEAFLQEYDNGKMDGWNSIECGPKPQCPYGPALKSVLPEDSAAYIFLAAEYGFANRMFQTNQGPSFPAHQFLLAGTSQLSPTSPFFASENPNQTLVSAGCASDAGQSVSAIGPGGAIEKVFPCFEHQTLPDLLQAHRPPLTWRYYATNAKAVWTAPNAIYHLCDPTAPVKGTPSVCGGPDWTNGQIVLNPPQFLSDVENGDLASVTWITPRGQESDHPRVTNGSGPSWVAAIVDTIGNSPYWNDTAILITWDDWGGWYDHVPPPPAKAYGYYELGFRVPLLVVSPYTPRSYVSNVQHDFGSILAFVERTFSLGTIPPHTFADARGGDALADFFDFSAPPRTFVPIVAPRSAESFIEDKSPGLPPDDD